MATTPRTPLASDVSDVVLPSTPAPVPLVLEWMPRTPCPPEPEYEAPYTPAEAPDPARPSPQTPARPVSVEPETPQDVKYAKASLSPTMPAPKSDSARPRTPMLGLVCVSKVAASRPIPASA